jgi:hypothetical protein
VEGREEAYLTLVQTPEKPGAKERENTSETRDLYGQRKLSKGKTGQRGREEASVALHSKPAGGSSIPFISETLRAWAQGRGTKGRSMRVKKDLQEKKKTYPRETSLLKTRMSSISPNLTKSCRTAEISTGTGRFEMYNEREGVWFSKKLLVRAIARRNTSFVQEV